MKTNDNFRKKNLGDDWVEYLEYYTENMNKQENSSLTFKAIKNVSSGNTSSKLENSFNIYCQKK